MCIRLSAVAYERMPAGQTLRCGFVERSGFARSVSVHQLFPVSVLFSVALFGLACACGGCYGHTYIYIYMCVCVCVAVWWWWNGRKEKDELSNDSLRFTYVTLLPFFLLFFLLLVSAKCLFVFSL